MTELLNCPFCGSADVRSCSFETATIVRGDALASYACWPAPTCIISDGPYGLGKFPGEAISPDGLADWYEPHAAAWAKYSLPLTTLWFWNSEIGWAKSHAALERNGWVYEETVVWDKGIAHVAGNCNSKTIRGVPVVTELAVRYTRKATLETVEGLELPLKEWLRAEWLRSGLPMYESNEACGVVNAATRKYLTQCHMWYFPPGEALVGMARWCTQRGAKTDRPYFSMDGKTAPTAAAWERMRAMWTHTHGLTNVWQEPPVHNGERVRVPGSASRYLHANQKPLALMERQIGACTQAGDVVWEPFGGLCSASIAAVRMGRPAYAAEINSEFHAAAKARAQVFSMRNEAGCALGTRWSAQVSPRGALYLSAGARLAKADAILALSKPPGGLREKEALLSAAFMLSIQDEEVAKGAMYAPDLSPLTEAARAYAASVKKSNDPLHARHNRSI